VKNFSLHDMYLQLEATNTESLGFSEVFPRKPEFNHKVTSSIRRILLYTSYWADTEVQDHYMLSFVIQKNIKNDDKLSSCFRKATFIKG